MNEGVITSTILAEIPDVQAIYLFGSMASGQGRADSDMDIAILPAAPLSELSRWELQEKLAVLVSRDVDLVDLRSASTVFRVQVLANGRRLYEGDSFARANFEATALSAYARLQEERRDILKDVQQSGRIYG